MKKEKVVKQLLTWLLILIIAVPPAAMGQDTGGASQSTFSEEQLAQMLAPIALYPDELLSQILMASTYPLEVVQASRWAKQNKALTGDALAKALEAQPWDPSVKSLINFPQVLDMMNEKLDWTGTLGDAFLAHHAAQVGAFERVVGVGRHLVEGGHQRDPAGDEPHGRPRRGQRNRGPDGDGRGVCPERPGDHDAHVVEMADGGWVQGQRILVALGRDFGLDGLGLETLGLDPTAIRPDGRLRIADGVYLIGDPAGPEMFTHVSHYQGKLAVRMALGDAVAPDYRAIPRAVFLEPELASVGLSLEGALAAGLDAFEKVADFASSTRGYELEAAFGHLAVVVDRASGTLVGASAVAPDASAAIHETVLAIHARTPVATLASMLHAFPTTSRVFDGLYADALAELRGSVVRA